MISLRKRTAQLLIPIMVLLALTGCVVDRYIIVDTNIIDENPEEDVIPTEPGSYTITFEYNDDNDTVSSVVVEHGETLKAPDVPARTNYLFDGWYVDKEYRNTYDFTKNVTSGFTLYAKWDVDYVTLTNTITTSILKANVKIINKSYNMHLFQETESVTSSGSGIIFHLSDENYYVLTNNHVTVLKDGYNYQSLKVVDYLGNEYNATRLHESAEYDLAVVYFQKTRDLNTIEIETKNLAVDADIAALGQPKGQANAITYGKVLEYKKVTLYNTPSYMSDVKFDVLAHNAPIDNGSSGGALLNINLKIAGINYAASKANDEFITGYTIPAVKIHEYLNNYVFTT